MFEKIKDEPFLLIMFLGYPGSGKSYFSKQLAEKIGAVRLNGDSLRTAVYGSMENMPQNVHGPKSDTFKTIDYFTECILRAGKTIIYDAHHNHRATREKLERLAATYNAKPIIIWIKTPPEVAKTRATSREVTADQLQMSEKKYLEILKHQTTNFDIPLPHETVIEIDGMIPFEEQFTVFQSYFIK